MRDGERGRKERRDRGSKSASGERERDSERGKRGEAAREEGESEIGETGSVERERASERGEKKDSERGISGETY